MTRWTLCLLLASLLGAACEAKTTPQKPDTNANPTSTTTEGAQAPDAEAAQNGGADTSVPPSETPPTAENVDWAAVEAAPAADATPEQLAQVASDNTAFALDLYKKESAKPGNLFFSPYSISSALAMTWAGAAGATAEEMAKTLHYTLDADALHAAMAGLEKAMEPGEKGAYQLAIANRLWGQDGTPFEAPFLSTAKRYYGAGLAELDFKANPDGSRQTINSWISKQTQKLIPELLPTGSLTVDTRMVLTNAIYFKGTWVKTFDKDDTSDQPFYLADGTEATAPLMTIKDTFRYGSSDDVQLLAMPYDGDRLEMLVILPKKKGSLAEVESKLSAESFAIWTKTLRETKVDVWLPRFKLKHKIALKSTLQGMGMTSAFSNAADFSRMTTAEDLYISDVFHEAFVELDEEGTEAAAATGVVMATKSAAPPKKTPRFRADHPFIFAIRDKPTGSILFLGRVAKP